MDQIQTKPDFKMNTWEAGIMFFLAFDGLYCLAFLTGMLSHYSFSMAFALFVASYGNITFYIYIVLKYGITNRSLQCFVGYSLPILIFWIMQYCRSCVESWYIGNYPYLGIIAHLMCPVAIMAFSIPIKKATNKIIFWIVFLSLFIMSLLIFITWYDWILSGHSARSLKFLTDEKRIINTLWITGNKAGYFIASIGLFLALLSLYGKYTKQIRIEFASIGYFIGSTLFYFVSVRGLLIGWIVVHCLLVIITGIWQKKEFFIIVPIILALNIFLLFHVGKVDSTRLLDRIKTTIEVINNDTSSIKKIMNIESENINDNKISATISQQPTSQQLIYSQPIFQQSNSTVKTFSNIEMIVVASPYSLPRGIIQQQRSELLEASDRVLYNKLSNIFNMDVRSAIYLIAIDRIMANPILGYGNSLVLKIDDIYYRVNVHCNVLGVTLSLGLVGLTLYLIILIRGACDAVIIFTSMPEYGWIAVIFLFSFFGHFFDKYTIDMLSFWIPIVVMRSCVKTHSYKLKEQILPETN
ncbi:MAG: hypothetical protein LBE12_04525 [Planctomycetaceae bacterium]|jgi:hypothetical protein|nr:hypothetical protein [Planctomycetaceae bacterium]